MEQNSELEQALQVRHNQHSWKSGIRCFRQNMCIYYTIYTYHIIYIYILSSVYRDIYIYIVYIYIVYILYICVYIYIVYIYIVLYIYIYIVCVYTASTRIRWINEE